MKQEKLDKRACGRFRVMGATVRMKNKRTLFRKEAYSPEVFPLIDLSRGGVRFLTSIKLQLDKPVILKISIPGEEEPLELFGHIRWFAAAPDRSYRYQFGVQFDPYGDKEGFNPPRTLDRLIALEQANPVECEGPDIDG